MKQFNISAGLYITKIIKQRKRQLIYEVNWMYGNFLCNKFISHCELNIPKMEPISVRTIQLGPCSKRREFKYKACYFQSLAICSEFIKWCLCKKYKSAVMILFCVTKPLPER